MPPRKPASGSKSSNSSKPDTQSAASSSGKPTSTSKESSGQRSGTQSRGLGFDPAESSDLTAPSEINLNDRPDLLNWQYLEGGERLPLFFDQVPHLREREPRAKRLLVSIETQELCQRIAKEARQAQLESVTLKQKADTLQSEKELLEWHLASNGKATQTHQSTIDSAEIKLRDLQEKIKAVQVEGDAAELLNTGLVIEVDRMERDFAEAQQRLEEEQNAFDELASRKHDYLADIALERRIADHERVLRFHQWQKLARAANVDKKHHVKYDLGVSRKNSCKLSAFQSNLDYLVFDAYKQVKNFKELDVAAYEDVVGRARQVFREQLEELDPLDDFVEGSAAGGSQPRESTSHPSGSVSA